MGHRCCSRSISDTSNKQTRECQDEVEAVAAVAEGEGNA